MIDESRPTVLTEQDRAVLAKGKITRCDRAMVPHLWDPFRDAYLAQVRQPQPPEQDLWRAFRSCAHMMLALDRPYWAFTWEQILTWRDESRPNAADTLDIQRRQWDQCWADVTATLFFLDVLPYREAVYQQHHGALARTWLGEEQVREIEERFLTTAHAIGYRYERQVLRRGVSILLSVLGAAGKRDLADLTRADLEAWEHCTGRSSRVASSGVTMAERVLVAMGYDRAKLRARRVVPPGRASPGAGPRRRSSPPSSAFLMICVRRGDRAPSRPMSASCGVLGIGWGSLTQG